MHDWWPDTWEKLPASAPPPALDDEELFVIEASNCETGAQLRITGGARKMAQNAPKTHQSHHDPAQTESEAPPTVCVILPLQDHGNVQPCR